MRLHAIVGAVASALVACNLLAGFESEYSVGGSSGATEAGTTDTNVAPDVVTPDGAPDAPNDTGSDAKPFSCADEDGGSLGFCQDFEKTGLATPFGFDAIDDTAPDASITIVNGPPSRFLRVVMPNPTGANAIRTLLGVQVAPGDPRAWSHYELDFDVRIPDTSIDYAALAILTFPNGGADREHGISIEGDPQRNLGRLQPQGVNTLKADKDTWFHCHLTMDREDGGTTFRRRIVLTNTSSGLAKEVDNSPARSSPTSGGTDVRVGAFNTSPDIGSITVELDNVVARRW
ncbi:MAG: hypothetical protein JST00_27010 [Deltaproteobacteria bacterium]|nr:hypothetical protein [Deltaproteobacteria bacterium]